MDNSDAFIVCNGFKDKSYIEMALLSQKAGKKIFLVVERRKEMTDILDLAKQIGVKPNIGFRLKLNAQSGGLWDKSSGTSSKFGLFPFELLSAIEELKKQKALDCAKMIHFHIGSQVPSIQPIKLAIQETSRIFSELVSLGCPIEYIDVGGGLGIDYDGSGESRSSINYDIQEYANDIVFGIKSICDEKKINHPNIVSESGRFLLAQSSLLVFNILDSNFSNREKEITVTKDNDPFIKAMYDIYKNIHQLSYNETFNDLESAKKEMYQRFVLGVLSLKEMAVGQKIYWKALGELKELVQGNEEYEEIFDKLREESSDTYFCNFSVFQSLPDSWALSYIFPILPIHRLDEKPTRRAKLADLTCDSDGCISKMVDYDSWKIENHLPVHELKENEEYLMGVFLTGAYQEILGDLHNLFGDTDAVHIKMTDDGQYNIEHRVEGDTISEVLDYVEYNKKELLRNIHKVTEDSVKNGNLSRQEAGFLLEKFERNLSYYTYLK